MLRGKLCVTFCLLVFASSGWAQERETLEPPGADAGSQSMAVPSLTLSGVDRGGRVKGAQDASASPAMPAPPRSAEFKFKRGDLEVTIDCAENEQIKPCADAALTLLDKFGSVAGSLPQQASAAAQQVASPRPKPAPK